MKSWLYFQPVKKSHVWWYGLKNYKSKSNSNFFSFPSICDLLCFIFQPIQFALNQVLWDLPWRISPYPRAEMSYYHVLSKIWTVTKLLGFIMIGQLFWLSTKLLLQEMLELGFRMKVNNRFRKYYFHFRFRRKLKFYTNSFVKLIQKLFLKNICNFRFRNWKFFPSNW